MVAVQKCEGTMNPDAYRNVEVTRGVSRTGRHDSEGRTVVTLSSLEEVCESKGISLVVHPIVRKAIKGYEESFYVGACCFLRGETDGIYFLPLMSGGYVRMQFTKRRSAGAHPILRIDPVAADGLARIKATLTENAR